MRTLAALLLTAATSAALAQGGTPPPATNQCWDAQRAELRDKSAAATAGKAGDKQAERDRSPGRPAPPSGNAAGSGEPKSPNAVRPPGVTDC